MNEKKKKYIKNKVISFRVAEDFPLSSVEIRFFLENVDEFFMQLASGMESYEAYIKTRVGRKMSQIYTKIYNYNKKKNGG